MSFVSGLRQIEQRLARGPNRGKLTFLLAAGDLIFPNLAAVKKRNGLQDIGAGDPFKHSKFLIGSAPNACNPCCMPDLPSAPSQRLAVGTPVPRTSTGHQLKCIERLASCVDLLKYEADGCVRGLRSPKAMTGTWYHLKFCNISFALAPLTSRRPTGSRSPFFGSTVTTSPSP